jgi:hypothetical protein
MEAESGIDATFGPCLQPPPNYTPDNPGGRYASVDVYRDLVILNATVGLRTIVYDARVWASDPAVRDAAVTEWQPYLPWIAAWDMGDEFDPTKPEWAILIERWTRVRSDVLLRTGVPPFTNHLATAVDQAIVDLPGSTDLLSFDQYEGDLGVAIARRLAPQVQDLMCALNVLPHGFIPVTPDTVRLGGQALQAAGCTHLLIFGGVRPYDTDGFTRDSVVDDIGTPTPLAAATDWAATQPDRGLVPVGPARLIDTRVNGEALTVDGQFQAIGRRRAGAVVQMQVTGRGGIPFGATAVAVNTTLVGPASAGFVTVYPCGQPRPVASTVNYERDETAAGWSLATLGVGGSLCIYTHVTTDVIIDVQAFVLPTSRYRPLPLVRLADTRTDGETVDGRQVGAGRRPAGSVTSVQVGGRGGVPLGASSAMLTITATEATAAGFVTAFACGTELPTASLVNVGANGTESNSALVPLDVAGRACLYTHAPAHLVVDVAGWAPAGSRIAVQVPRRLADTRMTGAAPPAMSTTVVELPADVGAPTTGLALVNITVVSPGGDGFVTIHPCSSARPPTSNLNMRAGATAANSALVQVPADRRLCVYAHTPTHLVVDVQALQAAVWPDEVS